MNETTQDKMKFFTYKGLQLVRCGDVLYYGNMTDDYVTMIQVLSKQKATLTLMRSRMWAQKA